MSELNEPFKQHVYVGQRLTTDAALTWIRDQNWDTNGDGTGDPHEGMWCLTGSSAPYAVYVYNGNAWVKTVQTAEDVFVDASGFSGGALDTGDDNVQVCIEKLTNLGNYSSIYDPASFTVSLLPEQSGCLHNTENSTAGKFDPHVVTLPTPEAGLCYTIAMAKDIPLFVEVDDPATEYLRVVGQIGTTVTKIKIATGAVKVVAISTTQWLLFVEGIVQLDPDTSDTEYEYSEGMITLSRGSVGDSDNGIPQIKGMDNQSLMGNSSWGQTGLAIGAQAEHIAHGSFSSGKNARAREHWNSVHVVGEQLDYVVTGTKGQAQATFGCKFVGKSENGATDITGAYISVGGNTGIYLDPNTVFKFRGQVSAKCKNHENACKTWEYEMTVACNNSGIGTVLSQTIIDTHETAHLNESAWAIAFQITTPAVGQDMVSMVCTGESGRDVYFVGSIETSEVSVYSLS